jgi:hypothetical protein
MRINAREKHILMTPERDVVLEKASCRAHYALWTVMALFTVVYVGVQLICGALG